MTLSRALRRHAALAAMFGIALQAFWPLVAQARSGRSIAMPICSVEGPHRSIEVPIDGGKTRQTTEHCKLCVLGADRPAVSGSACAFAFPYEGEAEDPFKSGDSEPGSSCVVSARPRAPPAFL